MGIVLEQPVPEAPALPVRKSSPFWSKRTLRVSAPKGLSEALRFGDSSKTCHVDDTIKHCYADEQIAGKLKFDAYLYSTRSIFRT